MTTRTWRARLWPVGAIAAGASGVGLIAAQLVAAAGPPAGKAPAPATAFQIVTVAADAPGTADGVSPGTTGALVVKFKNQTGVAARITNLFGNGASSPSNCAVTVNASGVTAWVVTNPTIPGRSSVSFTIPNGVAMGGTAANSCQGQTLTVPVAATAVNAR